LSQVPEPPTGPDDPALGQKYTGFLDGLTGALQKARDTMTGQTPEQIEMTNSFATMLKDLRYIESPANERGETSIMNTDYFAPIVAYHLVRCGWRPHDEKRKIKPRRVPLDSLDPGYQGDRGAVHGHKTSAGGNKELRRR